MPKSNELICEKCSHLVCAEEVEPSFGGTTPNHLEVKFPCPHCGQGYYNFIPLSSFTLDEDGKEAV